MTTLLPGPVETEVARNNAGTHPAGMMPRPFWKSAADTARAGVEGLEVNRRVVLVGPNRFMPIVSRMTPTRISNALTDRATTVEP